MVTPATIRADRAVYDVTKFMPEVRRAPCAVSHNSTRVVRRS